MTEFTGERVIPGEVNDDLWAEHIARYAFASGFAADRRVLDIGCGAGYGAAELATQARLVAAIDVSSDALEYARKNYRPANVHYAQASALSLPVCDQSFDLITAFEVIEHLSDWKSMLSEAHRVLRPGGLFLVSTPNRLYYAESRIEDGPNPFHVHEFECEEFRKELEVVFPSVTLLLQNRLESFAFYPQALTYGPAQARLDGTRGTAEQAHFFIAVCSTQAPANLNTFVYVPRAANMLREREQHIQLLKQELTQTKAWLDRANTERQQLLEAHDRLNQHLEQQNVWAQGLERDFKAAMERVVALQDELRGEQERGREVAANYDRKISSLEKESLQTAEWAAETDRTLVAKCDELAEAVRLLNKAEASLTERTLWGLQLKARVERVEHVLDMVRESRWVKLGRLAGLGPKVEK
ncbi:MAG TPA: methyltransferase domain-containing protein [Bryobacteraceae bacterium]|nr:methyltransferase domain-containing protein [Bryobacteraceae bacterium]